MKEQLCEIIHRESVTSLVQLFHDGGRYYIETSPLICRPNQWTGFYMITVSVMKEFKLNENAICEKTI